MDDAAVEALRAVIRGDVLKPGDPGYGDRPIFNAMHVRRPALIVRCAGTADVVDAVSLLAGTASWYPCAAAVADVGGD